jgi:hypothetical protein
MIVYKTKKMGLAQGVKSKIDIIVTSLVVLGVIGFFIWVQSLHH